MAGEWIKVEAATADKPEVSRMARILGLNHDAVFGKLVRLWAWMDTNSVDGVVDGVVDADIDRLCRCDGFTAACTSVGWLQYDAAAERVTLPNFDRHNGETAKQRAMKNRRQAKWRENVDVPVGAPVDGRASTKASTREEKRREDIKQEPIGRQADRFSDFWAAYPKRVKRKPAEAKWKAKGLDARADEIIADVRNRLRADRRWRDGFIPDPTTYLTQERWDDELQGSISAPSAKPAGPSETPLERAVAYARQQHGYGAIDAAERDRLIGVATEKHRGVDA